MAFKKKEKSSVTNRFELEYFEQALKVSQQLSRLLSKARVSVKLSTKNK